MEREIARFGLNRGKWFAFIELGRPWNACVLGLFAVIGFVLVNKTIELTTIYAFFSFVFLYMAGTTINDIYGMETDRINISVRPLPSNRLTIKEATLFSAFFYIAGLILAQYIAITFFFWTLVFCIMSLLYSVKPVSFALRWYAKSLALALVTVFIPMSAGASISSKIFCEASIVNITLSMTLFFMFIAIANDLKDLKGDAETEKRTLALMLGEKRTILLSAIGTIFFFALTNYFLISQLRNNIWFMIFCLIIASGFIYTYFIEKNYETLFTKTRLILLVYVIGLLIAMLY